MKMGVSAGYLSQIANGRRPWTPKMREKVAAVLGEVPGQGIVYRQRWGVLRIHVAGGARPRQHGSEGPGAGRVGVAGPGEGRARTVRPIVVT